jgi:hypothetical protein
MMTCRARIANKTCIAAVAALEDASEAGVHWLLLVTGQHAGPGVVAAASKVPQMILRAQPPLQTSTEIVAHVSNCPVVF